MSNRILLGLGLLTVFMASVAAQGDDAQSLADAIAGLKTAVKEKQDPDQIHYIKIVGEKWAAADEKQRKEIFKLVRGNLKSRNPEVKDATVEALGMMNGGKRDRDADTATKLLDVELRGKACKDSDTYKAAVMKAMGRLQRPKGATALIKELKKGSDQVVASAAAALGQFTDADIRVKKEVVEELIKIYTGADSKASDPRDTTAKRKLEILKPAMDASLKSLTRQTNINNAPDWRTWWNKEGKKDDDWAKPEKEEKADK
jgi:hypothetical protein